jgi:hypothetical protein
MGLVSALAVAGALVAWLFPHVVAKDRDAP